LRELLRALASDNDAAHLFSWNEWTNVFKCIVVSSQENAALASELKAGRKLKHWSTHTNDKTAGERQRRGAATASGAFSWKKSV
ncbi:MAG TPA: hypothetical protein VLJ21_04425, partial [Candidatus Binatia bacterium]|nr:hypothetical protein [Candidatus Binatia bacterium]